ncbi:MAG: LysM domain-containing protein [Planctomycetota bacterium]
MQPIERYALVTLLFLVVLVVVVAMWDDGSAEGAAPGGSDARDTNVATRVEERRTAPRGSERRSSPATRPGVRPRNGGPSGVPISGRQGQSRGERVTTRTDGNGTHRVDRRSANPADPAAAADRTPRAPSRAELDGLMQPEQRGGAARKDSPFIPRPRSSGPSQSPSGTLNSSVADSGQIRQPARPSGSSAAPSITPRKTPRAGAGSPSRSSASRGSASNAPKLPRPESNRPAKKPAAAAAGTRAYTIRSGDSLERIARREMPAANTNAAVEEIARLNALSKPYTIYAGDELKLPSSTSLPAAAGGGAPGAATAKATGGRSTYTVRSGDVLSSVLVARYGTYKRSIALVKELNPGLDPDVLREGAKIVMPRPDEVPGGTAVAASAPAAQRRSTPRRSTSSSRSEYVVR